MKGLLKMPLIEMRCEYPKEKASGKIVSFPMTSQARGEFNREELQRFFSRKRGKVSKKS